VGVGRAPLPNGWFYAFDLRRQATHSMMPDRRLLTSSSSTLKATGGTAAGRNDAKRKSVELLEPPDHRVQTKRRICHLDGKPETIRSKPGH
jgi:hypothetical protein